MYDIFFFFFFFFFNDTATTEIYTLSLHDAPPIEPSCSRVGDGLKDVPVRGQAAVDGEVLPGDGRRVVGGEERERRRDLRRPDQAPHGDAVERAVEVLHQLRPDRLLGHLRMREAGGDAVDPDAVLRELQRHRAVEA